MIHHTTIQTTFSDRASSGIYQMHLEVGIYLEMYRESGYYVELSPNTIEICNRSPYGKNYSMDEGASYENNRITRISTSKTKKVINLQIVQSSTLNVYTLDYMWHEYSSREEGCRGVVVSTVF